MSVVPIQAQELAKTFGTIRALDGLDLEVAEGEVHGFLGPNGAGKSTTIRVLLGLQRRDAGEVTVLGGDPWDDAVELHRRLTYVPGDVHLWSNLTGGEAIDLLGNLRGGLDRGRRDDLVERFALDPTKRCSTYSKGNRQKVALIAGLAADVELYLLDEPTSGLDPLLMRTFQEVIREVREAGRTVLLSSHILGEVEALCDRVSIIREGRIVESGPLEDLRHLTRTSVVLRTAVAVPELADLPGIHDLHVEGLRATFDVEPAHLDELLSLLSGVAVVGFTASPPTLEQLFLRHYDMSSTPGDGAATAASR
ncbi:MAG: ABC transporter ATP-binding protein [Nitriliruptoraceae bacterium]